MSVSGKITREEKWWNTDVRIEDDVLMTEDGSANMPAGALWTVANIERTMALTGLSSRG